MFVCLYVNMYKFFWSKGAQTGPGKYTYWKFRYSSCAAKKAAHHFTLPLTSPVSRPPKPALHIMSFFLTLCSQLTGDIQSSFSLLFPSSVVRLTIHSYGDHHVFFWGVQLFYIVRCPLYLLGVTFLYVQKMFSSALSFFNLAYGGFCSKGILPDQIYQHFFYGSQVLCLVPFLPQGFRNINALFS